MTSLALAFAFASQAELRVEAESGKLIGVAPSASRAGYSGSGYVTGFDQPEDRVTIQVEAPKAGIFSAVIRYCSPSGEKGFEIAVNGLKISGLLKATGGAFTQQSIGRVELKRGRNELRIEKGWGYYDVDSLVFSPAPPVKMLRRVPARTADPQAAPEATALLSRLCKSYGIATLSGQYEIRDSDYVKKATGKAPAVLGGDLMEYSPSRRERGADPKLAVEKLVARAKKGQIITLSWHWNAPSGLLDRVIRDEQGRDIDARWYKGFYTNATTFDLAAALAQPTSRDYKLLLRDIDAIAIQLKKFQNAGVPVLWRPLHEAEGRWFWWGAKGPDAFKRLWGLLFQRLTHTHKLHNLLWVHNCVSADWYPGDGYVDIVGVDAYPVDDRDSLSMVWDELIGRFDGRKLLALTEIGGVPDVERAWGMGVRWSYFTSWVGTVGPDRILAKELKRRYGSPRLRHAP